MLIIKVIVVIIIHKILLTIFLVISQKNNKKIIYSQIPQATEAAYFPQVPKITVDFFLKFLAITIKKMNHNKRNKVDFSVIWKKNNKVAVADFLATHQIIIITIIIKQVLPYLVQLITKPMIITIKIKINNNKKVEDYSVLIIIIMANNNNKELGYLAILGVQQVVYFLKFLINNQQLLYYLVISNLKLLALCLVKTEEYK